MFSQALKTQLVFALLLAMFVAWGGHAAAWLANPVHHGDATAEGLHDHGHGHGHDHGEQAEAACSLCPLQHEHASLAGDHLHETPFPTVPIKLHAQAEPEQPQAAQRQPIPDAPVFLIERPPRGRFVL